MTETIDTLEPILFTELSAQLVNQAKVSQLLPIMRVVASDLDLNINIERDFRIVKRIIINSIKQN